MEEWAEPPGGGGWIIGSESWKENKVDVQWWQLLHNTYVNVWMQFSQTGFRYVLGGTESNNVVRGASGGKCVQYVLRLGMVFGYSSICASKRAKGWVKTSMYWDRLPWTENDLDPISDMFLLVGKINGQLWHCEVFEEAYELFKVNRWYVLTSRTFCCWLLKVFFTNQVDSVKKWRLRSDNW